MTLRSRPRTWALVLGTALTLAAASCKTARVRPPVPAGAVEICETCVGTVEGVRVGVSNIFERRLAGPDGEVRARTSARLSLWRDGPDGGTASDAGELTVIVGSRFTVGGVLYEVVDIDAPPGAPGAIVLRKVGGGNDAGGSGSGDATPRPSPSS